MDLKYGKWNCGCRGFLMNDNYAVVTSACDSVGFVVGTRFPDHNEFTALDEKDFSEDMESLRRVVNAGQDAKRVLLDLGHHLKVIMEAKEVF